jgi:NhaP-type Na+/H+ or K+/H+ antiporter
MGLYMNYKGKTRVSVDAHHMLHNVWNLITFAAESGIFVLSGAIVSTKGKNFFTF